MTEKRWIVLLAAALLVRPPAAEADGRAAGAIAAWASTNSARWGSGLVRMAARYRGSSRKARNLVSCPAPRSWRQADITTWRSRRTGPSGRGESTATANWATAPSAPPPDPRHWTAACYGTTDFLVWVLRAVNIPAQRKQSEEEAAQFWERLAAAAPMSAAPQYAGF